MKAFNIYSWLLALAIRLPTWRSYQPGFSWRVRPSNLPALTVLSISGTNNCGSGLVVFPRTSISGVFEMFNLVLILATQCFIPLTSSAVTLVPSLLMVIPSANFTTGLSLGSASCMSYWPPRRIWWGQGQLLEVRLYWCL